MKKTIYIGADSAGFALKEHVKALLEKDGYTVKDCGTDSEASCHYPIFASAVCEGVLSQIDSAFGILICGTGIGVSIAANKVKGAYAACVHDVYQAQRAELSNHANIITLGSQVVGNELAKCIVKEYLSVTYDENSRSAPKLARIYEYEAE